MIISDKNKKFDGILGRKLPQKWTMLGHPHPYLRCGSTAQHKMHPNPLFFGASLDS